MTTVFNTHGWNDLDNVMLPGKAMFRVEIHQTIGDGPEMHTITKRYVGASDNTGTLYLILGHLELDINRCKFVKDAHTKIKVRLWEEY